MAENTSNNSDDYKIQRKNESIKDKIFGKISEFVGGIRSKENGSSFDIKSIIFGLFALIGFIIIVYSNICSSCRATFSINSKYCICCCNHWVFYFGRNVCWSHIFK